MLLYKKLLLMTFGTTLLAYSLMLLDDYINRMSWVRYMARIKRMYHKLTHNFFFGRKGSR